MRKIISNFPQHENIILATDDDREGEAIAWHICQVFGLPVETTKRIVFHEVTKTAITEAVSQPTTINMSLVNAQKARQVLDMIVGYKISPYLWKVFNSNDNKALSAGRCQTPALRLVYENEEENKKSQMITQYKIRASFTSKSIIFDLNREFTTSEQVLDFLEKTKQFQHMLQIEATHETKRAPPKPFNTSRLLQTASNTLHMTTKETMNLAQQLYQSGHITYMRTESSQYSPVFLEKMRTYIISRWGEPNVGDLSKIEQKDKVNPHEAIRVTNINTVSPQTEDVRLSSLYKMIWKNTVESCMADAVYKNTSVKLTAPQDAKYCHVIEIPVFLGWKAVVGGKGGEDTVDKQSGLLFFMRTLEQSGKPVLYNYVESEMVARNKHSYYTEAGIIHKLEELGIGRPSTFSSIVDTIQQRGYVSRKNIEGVLLSATEYSMNETGEIVKRTKEKVFGEEKQKLCIEPNGIMVLEFLLGNFENFFSYEYTKQMEDELDQVVTTGKDWSEICRNCYAEIKATSKNVNAVINQAYPIPTTDPNAKQTYMFSFNKYGPIIQEIDETTEGNKYIPVKKNVKIDVDKLKRGEYTLEDLAEIRGHIGEWEGEKVYIKTGRYGNYIEYGENKKSIKQIKKPIDKIQWQDIEPLLNEDSSDKPQKKRGVLRTLNEHMSVRNGKFGSYVYYKTPQMSKPMFLNIKHFPEGFMLCQPQVLVDWVCKTYKIST